MCKGVKGLKYYVENNNIMKILLFGSTGMLGNYVFRVLSETHDVACVVRSSFDIENDKWSTLNQVVLQSDCDIIINCAGVIPQKKGNTDFSTFIRVNSLFPHKLQEYALKYKTKFIHITTDCVFDGKTGNYTSTDSHTADDLYGITKSLGELDDATVIRTSIIGEEKYGKKSLLEWIKSNKNGSIKGYTNHYWNGVTCLTLARIINQIIETNIFWKGVKHVFSPDVVSKYDLCCYVNQIYNLNITIEKYEAIVSKNMTLAGDILFLIKPIYEQIHELYDLKG